MPGDTVEQTRPQRGSRESWLAVAGLVTLFLLVRLGVQPLLPVSPSPKLVYAQFVLDARIAAARGTDRYRVREKLAGLRRGAPAGSTLVEYPPLALALMDVAAWGLPERPLDFEAERYPARFACMLFCIDALLFGLLLAWLFRRGSGRSRAAQLWPALFYIVAGLSQSYLLYRRLDLALAGLLLLAVLLALRGARAASLSALALATAFKIVPVLLFPLFAVVQLRERPGWKSGVRAAGVFAGVGLAVTLPYVLRDGISALSFVGFHAGRGLHNESLLGSGVLALALVGPPVEIVYGHGAHHLVSPLANALSRLSFAGSAAAALLGAFGLWRLGEAARSPERFVCAVVATTTGMLLGSTVLSAQYLLWLLPLIPLLPFDTFRRAAPFAAVAFGLTALVFPWWYADVSGVELFGLTRIPDAPHAPGTLALLARNAALLVFGVIVARDAFGRERSLS